jgi:hypothetical protein
MNKLSILLRSRKFWASIIGLIASIGLFQFGSIDADKLVDAILAIVGAFILGTGIENRG